MLTVIKRIVLTKLINLSQGKSKLAHPKIKTLQSIIFKDFEYQLTIRQLQYCLKELEKDETLELIETKKKVRYWKVNATKRVCISKKSVAEYLANPKKFRQELRKNYLKKKEVTEKKDTGFDDKKMSPKKQKVSPSYATFCNETPSYTSKTLLQSSTKKDDFLASNSVREVTQKEELYRIYGKAKVDQLEFKLMGRFDYFKIMNPILYLKKMCENDMLQKPQEEKTIPSESLSNEQKNLATVERMKAKYKFQVEKLEHGELLLKANGTTFSDLNSFMEPTIFNSILNQVRRNAGFV